MTVKELIEELQKLDPKLEVEQWSSGHDIDKTTEVFIYNGVAIINAN